MSAFDDMTDDDFIAPARVLVVDAQRRYEFLLRVIRYWLARKASFTEIEETLVAAGIAPARAEQIVELVIQDLQGRVRPPGDFPELDVPPAALVALGFSMSELQLPAGSPLEAETARPAPELAFAQPTDATAATVARARGASRTFLVGVLVFVALLVTFGLLLLLAT